MALAKKQISVGIDISNTRIIVVVMTLDKETGDLNIIGHSNVASTGMRKGMVTDIDEAISSLTLALEEAERMAGIPIEHALLSINGQHVSASNSRGVVAVQHNSNEITREDMDRAVEAAKAFSMPPNREVVHVIPRSFIVDGQDNIKDPLGMKGVRLEVDAFVVTASSPAVKNILKVAYQANLDIQELVLGPLAAARAILARKQKEIGVALVDIGGGGTSIVVYEEGEIIHSAFLPIGASHITNDIAIGLKTSIEFAESVKIEHGAASTTHVSGRDSINLSEIDPSINQGFISKKYIVEIIGARLEEIFMMVKDELRKIDRDGLLPAGLVLTGGGAKIEDIAEVARETTRLPVQLGKINEDIVSIDKEILDDPSYSTAIGLALWGIDMNRDQAIMTGIINNLKGGFGVLGKIKNIFKKR